MGGRLLSLSLSEVRDVLWTLGIEDRALVGETWRTWAAMDRRLIELHEESEKAKAEAAEQERKNSRHAHAHA